MQKQKSSHNSYVPANFEIPGQLEWKEWSKQQPKERLRLAKRAGRGALLGAAVTVGLIDIAVQAGKRVDKFYGHATTEMVASSSKTIAPKLTKRHELVTAKAEQTNARRHRLGAKALKAASVNMHKLATVSSRVAESQAAAPKKSFKESYTGQTNFLARKAYGYMDRRVEKAEKKRAEKWQQYQDYQESSREAYLDTNPNIVLDYKKKDFYFRSFNMTLANFNKLKPENISQGRFEDFVAQPRGARVEAINYDNLANHVLTQASEHKMSDGIMPLYLLSEVKRKVHKSGSELQFDQAAGDGYQDINLATAAIWKLGFVGFDTEGNSQVNPDLTVHERPGLMTYDIPFDAENPFHKTIGGADITNGAQLQLLVTPENIGLQVMQHDRQPVTV